jgi:hypothetical protein
LFEASSPSDPVSRASLLLTVASKLEKSGRMEAAARVYHQILKDFARTAQARDAAHRLQLISQREASLDGAKVE